VNRNNTKTIGKHGVAVEKPLYKRISEGLMHVAAWGLGLSWDPGPKFTKLREYVSNGQTLTLPNFVALRPKVCEISVVQKFYSPEKIGQSLP